MSVDAPQEQATIELVEKRELIHLDERTVASQPDMLSAFRIMPTVHGLAGEIICAELPMDKAQWSKILSGSAHFPMNKLSRLMDICGSEAPLQFLNYRRGYEAIPRRRKSELELQLEATNQELEDERRKNEILAGILNGKS